MRQELSQGARFGMLTLTGASFRRKPGEYLHECQCDCGAIKSIRRDHLVRGKVVSCGCFKNKQLAIRRLVHGEADTPLHKRWMGMLSRCKGSDPLYGGRGIRVCDEWSDYTKFRDWALANGYMEHLTIERINVNGDYEPSNCTWIPIQDQQRNKRNSVRVTAFGETKTLAEWLTDSRVVKMAHSSMRARLARYPAEVAFTCPPTPRRALLLPDTDTETPPLFEEDGE